MGNERNYGIDLFRMVAMYMIVILHIMSHGGILSAVGLLSKSYVILWFLYIAAICAVNCYALISGYVGIHRVLRFSNIFILWLAAIALLVLFTKIRCKIKLKTFVAIFLPATFGVYLIHDNPLVRQHLISNRFVDCIGLHELKLVIVILSIGVFLFFSCSIIDMIRAYIFRRLNLNAYVCRLEKQIVEKIKQICK